MSWWFVGAAAVTVVSSTIQGMEQKNTAIESANANSKAQGDAIAAERLGTKIRNSYAAAFGEMRLALQKHQLVQQGTQAKAEGLAALGNAQAANAATGSIGASTAAVASDIRMRVDQALAVVDSNYENAVANYNSSLAMLAVNTRIGAPNTDAAKVQYLGPSDSEIAGNAVLSTAGSFASSYFTSKAQLGLGSSQPSAQTTTVPPQYQLSTGYSSLGLDPYNSGTGLRGSW